MGLWRPDTGEFIIPGDNTLYYCDGIDTIKWSEYIKIAKKKQTFFDKIINHLPHINVYDIKKELDMKQMKKKYAWKILRKGMKSDSGNKCKWVKNKWKTHKEELELCSSGFHASKLLFDAIQYVIPGIICLVEYKGKIVNSNDKFVTEKMRVIKTYKFTKRMAVEWSVYCARLCLKNFEKEYPKDKRPREAIEAAENWLSNPTQKKRSAARSAAGSAGSAAGSAMSAAESAAESAMSAVKKKMNNKLIKIIGYKK